MPIPQRIVVVGGVAAGLKVAARARRLSPEAEITIVEKGELISYAGCGLPYYISGMVEERNELMATPIGVLRDPEFFANVKRIRARDRTAAVTSPASGSQSRREVGAGMGGATHARSARARGSPGPQGEPQPVCRRPPTPGPPVPAGLQSLS